MSKNRSYKYYSTKLSGIRLAIQLLEEHYHYCDDESCKVFIRKSLPKLYIAKIFTWGKICELADMIDTEVLLKHIEA